MRGPKNNGSIVRGSLEESSTGQGGVSMGDAASAWFLDERHARVRGEHGNGV